MLLNTNVTASCHAPILLPGNFTLVFKDANTLKQKMKRHNLYHLNTQKWSFVFIRFRKEMKKCFHPSFHTGSPDALPERISAFRVSIQTVHEV